MRPSGNLISSVGACLHTYTISFFTEIPELNSGTRWEGGMWGEGGGQLPTMLIDGAFSQQL